MCIQCIRLLARRSYSAQSSPSLSVSFFPQVAPRPSPKYTSPFPASRRYGTAPTRRSGAAVQTRNAFARVRFTRDDIPPREYWEAHIRPPLVSDLSADECLQTAHAYADAALKNAPGWRERLIFMKDVASAHQSPGEREKGKGKGKGKGSRSLSAYTLHYIAVTLILNHMGAASHLATHILHTLTGLDYAPSVLTMTRMAMRQDMSRPEYEPAFEGLGRLLKRIDGATNGNRSTTTTTAATASKDGESDFAADACTLRGLIHAAENTREGDTNALRWFRRAYETSAVSSASKLTSPQVPSAENKQKADEAGASASASAVKMGEMFDPQWQWKVSFALTAAGIRLKRGEVEKARALYALASSSEIDSPAGYLGMARVLEKLGERDTDQYVESLETAAVSGNVEAARAMGTREWERAVEDGLSGWEKKKRQVLAEEWMAVAGASGPAGASSF